MISHAHRTIFVHVPKCGGQSIETMFLDDLGLTWAARLPLLLLPNSNPRVGPPRLAHLLASEYCNFYYTSQEMFESYYRFAIVRHPAKRVLSLFNYLPHEMSLPDFVGSWLPQQFVLAPAYGKDTHRYPGLYHFVRPQADWTHDGNGVSLVEDVFRLEEIAVALETIRARTGLKSDLKHVNKPAKRGAEVEDLTEKEHGIIRQLYAADYDILGPWD